MAAQAIFQLSDGVSAASADWGPWQTAGVPAPGLSFGAPGAPEEGVPIWKADLPADAAQAHAALDAAQEAVRQGDAALEIAEVRVEGLVRQRRGPQAFDVSFAPEPLAAPEQELLGLLQEAQYGRTAVSFGEPAREGEGWEQAVKEFQAFSERVQRTLTQYAWVETHQEGQLLVRTTVNWIGDMETAWQEALNPDQLGLHRRTLKVALSSRTSMLRSMIVVAAGASKIAVLLTTPGGAILALPATWKFIRQIHAEIGSHQQILEASRNGQ